MLIKLLKKLLLTGYVPRRAVFPVLAEKNTGYFSLYPDSCSVIPL
jgi:hypothetical protein